MNRANAPHQRSLGMCLSEVAGSAGSLVQAPAVHAVNLHSCHCDRVEPWHPKLPATNEGPHDASTDVWRKCRIDARSKLTKQTGRHNNQVRLSAAGARYELNVTTETVCLVQTNTAKRAE